MRRARARARCRVPVDSTSDDSISPRWTARERLHRCGSGSRLRIFYPTVLGAVVTQMMYNLRRMKRALGALHDAPGSPESWIQWLQEMGRSFGCTFSGFVRWTRGDDSQVLASVGLDDESIRAYHDHYAAVNPWILALQRSGPLPDGAVLPTEAFVSEAQLRRTEFYNDFARRLDTEHGVAAQIDSEAGVLHLSLVRPAEVGPFTSRELKRIGALMPHVRGAVAADRYATQLRAQAQATRDALDGLPYAVFVLGAVPFANIEARHLLATWPHVFRFNRGCLAIANAGADAALQQRINSALRGAIVPHVPLVLELTDRVVCRVTVIGGFGGTSWASTRPPLVIVQRVRSRADVQGMLTTEYGLSRREAEFAVTLWTAEKVRRASEVIGVSAHTGRLHLSRVFRKTGVHSQAELMALLRRLSQQ